MIYLDNAATTPLSKTVLDAMTHVMTSVFGNPSSLHQIGREANKYLREARNTVAEHLEVPSRQIVFNSGGTEGNNTAIKGYALAHQEQGKHLITTAIEHHSVLNTFHYLEERFGFEVTYLQPINGEIRPEQVEKALRDDTILVSMMFANNETGQILPIHQVGQLLQNHQAVLHVDAVQVAGKLPIRPQELGIDILTLSAHKFNGPKGVGILYHNGQLHFDSLLHGGDQEDKRRASTENMIGIIGLAAAFDKANEKLDEHYDFVSELRETFLEHLEVDYYINEAGMHLPYVINIGFPDADNGLLLTQLDLNGFAVSTGSACTAGAVEPSHVLEAMYGKDSKRLDESIRISISHTNSKEDLVLLAQCLNKILQK